MARHNTMDELRNISNTEEKKREHKHHQRYRRNGETGMVVGTLPIGDGRARSRFW